MAYKEYLLCFKAQNYTTVCRNTPAFVMPQVVVVKALLAFCFISL